MDYLIDKVLETKDKEFISKIIKDNELNNIILNCW